MTWSNEKPAVNNSEKFSPTEERLLKVLNDGGPHKADALRKCLWDEMGPLVNIQVAISKLRKKLRARGHDIVCEVFRREHFYRRVILLPKDYGDE